MTVYDDGTSTSASECLKQMNKFSEIISENIGGENECKHDPNWDLLISQPSPILLQITLQPKQSISISRQLSGFQFVCHVLSNVIITLSYLFKHNVNAPIDLHVDLVLNDNGSDDDDEILFAYGHQSSFRIQTHSCEDVTAVDTIKTIGRNILLLLSVHKTVCCLFLILCLCFYF